MFGMAFVNTGIWCSRGLHGSFKTVIVFGFGKIVGCLILGCSVIMLWVIYTKLISINLFTHLLSYRNGIGTL